MQNNIECTSKWWNTEIIKKFETKGCGLINTRTRLGNGNCVENENHMLLKQERKNRQDTVIVDGE